MVTHFTFNMLWQDGGIYFSQVAKIVLSMLAICAIPVKSLFFNAAARIDLTQLQAYTINQNQTLHHLQFPRF